MIKHFSLIAVAALVVAGSAFAMPPESVQLEKAQSEDVTAQQKYQTMIAEAGGGLKINMEACRGQPAQGRGTCVKEAQALYQKDMAAARDILRNPSASTSVAIRTEIRSTETPVTP
ncbi:MAG TPA: hypothetical protein VLJ57_14450 [Burkholderiaceae bacterium]|nr:hypothetical protein [Burkholderiaceae bacterium]